MLTPDADKAFRLLAHLARLGADRIDAKGLGREALEALREVMAASAGAVYLVDGEELQLVVRSGPPAETPPGAERLPIAALTAHLLHGGGVEQWTPAVQPRPSRVTRIFVNSSRADE